MDGDLLRLTMPASGPYARLARVAVTGLATRLGFSFDEVEELRLAVAEVCTRVIELAPATDSLEVCFLVGDDQLSVDIGLDANSQNPILGFDELAASIVDATVDEVEYRSDEQVIRVTKIHADDD